jgi:GNAT superfamily N-acetyltransferase
MDLGLRALGACTLQLGRSGALPERLQSIIEISSVYTAEAARRTGQATALLSQVCDEADAEGVVLMLLLDESNPGKQIISRVTESHVPDTPQGLETGDAGVTPSRADDLPDQWLERLYGRFGFATIQREPAVLMARPARKNGHDRQAEHA